MANEITVTSSMSVRKGNLQHQTQPASFSVTMTGTKGPTPGNILIGTAPTNIVITELTTRGVGWCRFQNLDATNAVAIGLYDDVTSEFYPFLKLKAGEVCVVRLHPHIGLQYEETGTGTSAGTLRLTALAENASLQLLAECFDD